MAKEIYELNGFKIVIDLSRDENLSEAGVAIMNDRYLLKEYDNEQQTWVNKETSPQECFARAACTFASDNGHAQRLYNYASNNWMMFATPILTNAGNERGLPISCFLNYVPDSVKGILSHHYENGFLSSYGGGIGGDWSSLRPSGSRTSRGNVSTGIIQFIKMMDSEMLAFQQGSTRRGSYAAYLSINHLEIEEFIDIRTPHGSDLNRRCLGTGFHHAVNIPDAFMDAVKKGESWDLIDPNTDETRKSVDARALWMKILTKRLETGEPYLHFIDTSNAALPEHLKEKGLRINNSNLCNEIYLPTSEDRTAVCCLSSVNLEYYEEWQTNEAFIPDMVEMLDNVLMSFIDKAPEPMWRAINSAKNSRDIGLGAMGFYLYLQKKGIPFESPMALGANRKIFKHIKDEAQRTNLKLGAERGEAPDAKGTGQRFSHLMAVAPNANISILCGNTSPSIEPYNANAFKLNTLSGSFLIKNKLLDKILQEDYNMSGKKLERVWSSIISNSGSVQQLDFLSVIHKEVFKTAMELEQLWIIEHAAVRQEFLCQGQSVNLFLPSNVHKNDLHKVHFAAWERGLKGLYYCRSNPIRKTEIIARPSRDEGEKETPMPYTQDGAVEFDSSSDCVACEG